jgi:tetratricopeptide (TPR) repeat protein
MALALTRLNERTIASRHNLGNNVSSNLPVVRQINILSIFFQVIFLAFLHLGFYQLDKTNYMIYAAVCYCAITLILRHLIPRHHRRGMSLYKKQNFPDAISAFEKSYLFFKNHSWLDEYRFITILSSSKISYMEMALLNQAFCLSQIGKKDESILTYQSVLKQFPDSKIAQTALKMMT